MPTDTTHPTASLPSFPVGPIELARWHVAHASAVVLAGCAARGPSSSSPARKDASPTELAILPKVKVNAIPRRLGRKVASADSAAPLTGSGITVHTADAVADPSDNFIDGRARRPGRRPHGSRHLRACLAAVPVATQNRFDALVDDAVVVSQCVNNGTTDVLTSVDWAPDVVSATSGVKWCDLECDVADFRPGDGPDRHNIGTPPAFSDDMIQDPLDATFLVAVRVRVSTQASDLWSGPSGDVVDCDDDGDHSINVGTKGIHAFVRSEILADPVR